MKKRNLPHIFYRTMFAWILASFTLVTFSQETDTAGVAGHFGGSVSVTNNGISIIPNLTLGKPAAVFDLSIGKKKLSFEPQFRFALEGKPWSFLFWWRYKLVESEKFRINIGAHPALSFRNNSYVIDEVEEEVMIVHRYLAAEIAPTYSFTKNINIGLYYLNGHGLDKGSIKYSHYLALRTGFSNIKITDQFYLRLNPQVYYLNIENTDGFYFSGSMSIVKKDFPVYISAMFNNPIHTNIPAGNEFLWNVSLTYTFNKEYLENK